MTPGAHLAAVIEVMDSLVGSSGPADAVLANYLKVRRFIGAKDRAAISERVYGLWRRHAHLGWYLERLGLLDTPRARVIADVVLHDQADLAGVRALFSGEGHSPEPIDYNERAFVMAAAGQPFDRTDMPTRVRTECPEWAEAPLRAVLGEDFIPEMHALNSPAALDLRVNLLVGGREEAIARLRFDGITAEPTPHSPLGLRVKGRPPLSASDAYQSGLVEVQDEGSQLLAALVEAAPGMQVIDFCAGAGGKTLALAAVMEGKGRVLATDINKVRLDHCGRRVRRAGAHNVERKVLQHERDPWVRRHKAKFDRVLVDAPCSGTGTWRRNPDARWNRRGPDLAELIDLQGRILESAARLAKPGGRVVYGTCSLLREENEAIVDAFLAAHPDYHRLRPDMRLTPLKHGTDGFFGAVLERDAAAVVDAAEET